MWGLQAHRRWHYRAKDGQPPRFVRWFIRFRAEPQPATLQNLVLRLAYTLICREMPWEVEAREKEEEEEERRLKHEKHHPLALPSPHSGADESKPCSPFSDEDSVHSARCGGEEDSLHTPKYGNSLGGHAFSDERGEKEHESDDESERAEREEEAEDIFFKRMVTAVGFVAVYLSWAMFTWFIFTCVCVLCRGRTLQLTPAPPPQLWHAGVPAAGPGRRGRLCQVVWYQLCAESSIGVAGHCARGGQGNCGNAHS